MKIKFVHTYQDIISLENLLGSWREFIKGKKNRTDVQVFSSRSMDNIINLHNDLSSLSYQHGPYQSFSINDPKPRKIHKSSVKDRLVHHAVYRILYPFFDKIFASDSFSCRNVKGTYRALNRSRRFGYIVGKNSTRTCWVLKCDIRKFFDNIDHKILVDILKQYISSRNIIWLLEKVIYSFSKTPGKGLPLGNLTSQLFVNIYMNEFDQFVKHKMKVGYYIRYADDFAVLSQDKSWLEELLPKMGDFLSQRLKLDLHPDKVFIKTIFSGVDFLGWVHFSDHRVLRTATKRRMFNKLEINRKPETTASYLGLLKHGNTYKTRNKVVI